MLKHFIQRLWLFIPQISFEFNIDLIAPVGLVHPVDSQTQFRQHPSQLFLAPPWQAEVFGSVIGATDNSRFVIGWKTHRLFFVKLRVSERGQTFYSIQRPLGYA